MELAVFIFLSSGLFLGWSLGANDAANIFGTAVATRMVRFATAAIITSVFCILGAVISGAGAAHTLGSLGSVNAIAGSFVVCLAAGYTVFQMTKLGLPVSTTQAIVGAIIGWNIFSGSATDYDTLTKIVSTWIICPALSALVAIPVFKLTEFFIYSCNFHLVRQDAYTRIALVIAGVFGAYSLGANNIANVVGVFLPVSPFSNFSFLGLFSLSSAHQLFLIGGIAIAVGVITYSKRVIMTVGEGISALSPAAAFVAVIAHSVVLFLFSSEGIEHFLASHGLPTIPLVPVSSSQAIVGAVIGIGLIKGVHTVRWRLVGKITVAWTCTPLIAAIISLVALFILQNVFGQEVYRTTSYSLNAAAFEKISQKGLPVEKLMPLTGETFKNGTLFLRAVERQVGLNQIQEKQLLWFAEIGVFRVEANLIQQFSDNWLSKEQLDALRRLTGKTFNFKWQLAQALADEHDAWKLLPESKINKLHNKEINNRLNAVFRAFSVAQ